jgi:hypothetical protein
LARPLGSVDTQQDVTADLRLPHAGGCCTHSALWPEYTPKTNYRLAAAVIDFSGGSGSGCQLETGRQDTKIYLANDGTLIVVGTKGQTRKTLTFDGLSFLAFANVPIDATGGERTCKAGNKHYKAYAAMVHSCTEGRCPKDSQVATGCKGPNLIMVGDPVDVKFEDPMPVLAGARTTAECSNNQWP